MNSTRKQRRDFIKNIKKSKPNITKQELEEIKNNMSTLGKEKHENLLREKYEKIANTVVDEIDLDDELDITPDDINE